MYNIKNIREDFPALHQLIYQKPLVYLDNAATTQKPSCVIQTLKNYYEIQNSNIHRGVHYLSQQATTAFEEVRKTVQVFMNAPHSHEIIFTRGTTESINLVASSFTKKFLKKGDKILISAMEHHSNIVPWQIACEEKNAQLNVIPMDKNGELCLDEFEKMLTDNVKLIAVTHISNALGTVNPMKEIIKRAHQKNIPVLVDGAQSAPHIKIDVQDLDCDFYCFSGHKVYAPMGIGILYGKEKWLNEMPPYQGGGEMIKEMEFLESFREALDDVSPDWPSQEIGFGTALFSLGLRDMDEEESQQGKTAGEANRIPLGPGILNLVELIIILERKFGVEVDDTYFLDLWRVRDIFEVLNGRIVP